MVPAESSRQAWPIAAPTATVCIWVCNDVKEAEIISSNNQVSECNIFKINTTGTEAEINALGTNRN